jgi:hypothetical protein
MAGEQISVMSMGIVFVVARVPQTGMKRTAW